MPEIEYDLTKAKQISLITHLMLLWNKNPLDFLPFFADFISILENCGANFKIFSRIKDSVRTLQLNLSAKLCESSRIGRFRLKRPFCRDLLDLLASRPPSSSKNAHFQKNVARCTTFLVKMSFICMRMKNDFHIKGSAPTLVLKQRPGGTQKWPIVVKFVSGCKITWLR